MMSTNLLKIKDLILNNQVKLYSFYFLIIFKYFLLYFRYFIKINHQQYQKSLKLSLTNEILGLLGI
jgi:hypothetical protein